MTLRPLAGLLAASSLLALTACNDFHQESGSEIIPQSEAQMSTHGHGVGVSKDVLEVHNDMLVMDTHLDTPAYFHSAKYDFSKRQTFEADGTHVAQKLDSFYDLLRAQVHEGEPLRTILHILTSHIWMFAGSH